MLTNELIHLSCAYNRPIERIFSSMLHAQSTILMVLRLNHLSRHPQESAELPACIYALTYSPHP